MLEIDLAPWQRRWLETAEIEHLDFEPTCDGVHCERPVVWEGTLSCCGIVVLACDPHRRYTDRWLAGRRGTAICRTCKHHPRAVLWRPHERGGGRG